MFSGLHKLNKIAILTSFIGLSAGLASAGTMSFTGTFAADDDMWTQTFSVVAPATVTLATSGYAAGGFDPILSLFDSAGVLKATNDDGTCSQVGTGPGGCLDSYLQLTALPSDTYTLVLTESDNSPIGPNLSNGFSETGNGNFTSGLYGCLTSDPFCDPSGLLNDTGNWAVDISVASLSTATPEPGTAWLLITAFGAAFFMRRKIGSPAAR